MIGWRWRITLAGSVMLVAVYFSLRLGKRYSLCGRRFRGHQPVYDGHVQADDASLFRDSGGGSAVRSAIGTSPGISVSPGRERRCW